VVDAGGAFHFNCKPNFFKKILKLMSAENKQKLKAFLVGIVFWQWWGEFFGELAVLLRMFQTKAAPNFRK